MSINCYQCGNIVPADSSFTSFCNEECCDKYNDKVPTKKKRSLEEWMQHFKDKSKVLKVEETKNYIDLLNSDLLPV